MPTTTKINLRALLAELVQMQTIAAEKDVCKAALDWCKHQVRGLPLFVHEFTHNGHSSLILTTRRTKRPKVLLHSHIDVVSAAPELFQLTELKGRYYGRGVFDMKIAVAAYLKLLLELGTNLSQYDLGVILTTDEEPTAGVDGAKPLVAAGWGGGVVINPDSVETDSDWAIQGAAKGMARFNLVATGKTGHGSRPWLGRSPISELMSYLGELTSHFPSEPCGDPGHAHNTVNIGAFHAGEVFNQVPSKAEAKIEFRFVPGYSLGDMERLVREVAASYEHVSIKLYAHAEAISIDPNHPEVNRLADIIIGLTGSEPKLVLSHGASESNYYASQGMPVLMFSPPGGGHHSNEEWVDAQAAEQFYDVIREFIEQTAKID